MRPLCQPCYIAIEDDGLRFCSGCKNTLPLSDFSKSSKRRAGVQSVCKPCMMRIVTANRYGISREALDGLKKDQSRKCGICAKEGRLCVDHDHTTGRVRGLLCNGCNGALGVFGDSIEGVKRALSYLESAPKWGQLHIDKQSRALGDSAPR